MQQAHLASLPCPPHKNHSVPQTELIEFGTSDCVQHPWRVVIQACPRRVAAREISIESRGQPCYRASRDGQGWRHWITFRARLGFAKRSVCIVRTLFVFFSSLLRPLIFPLCQICASDFHG